MASPHVSFYSDLDIGDRMACDLLAKVYGEVLGPVLDAETINGQRVILNARLHILGKIYRGSFYSTIPEAD